MNRWVARFAHAAYARVTAPQTRGHLARLEREQWLPPEEIQRRALARLKETLVYAGTKVPFYRERFADAGFDPEKFRSPEELQGLPLLTKDDLQSAGTALLSSDFRPDDLTRSSSGGSTGRPVAVLRERADLDRSMAALRRIYRWYGFDVGDPLALLWGALRDERAKKTFMSHVRGAFVNDVFLNAFELDAEKMEAYAETLRKFRPRALKGYVNPLVLFARFLLERRIDHVRPGVVLTGAETLFEFQREIIAEALDCPVRNTYGGRETGHMAAECAEAGRLHLFEDIKHFEFLRDGDPVPPGELGEVVFTDLYRRAMPLIRYRVEDLAVPSGERCSCGRGLGVIDRIAGRVQDVVVTPDHRYVAGELFPHLFKDFPIQQFQVVQKDVRSLVLRLIPGPKFRPDTPREIERRLREFLGDGLDLRFEVVPAIELTATGKHRLVISEVSAPFR